MQYQPAAHSIRTPSPLDHAIIRKGTIRSRPTNAYDMDDLALAHAMLAMPPREVAVGRMRDGSRDVRSFGNLQRIAMLQDVFPDVSVDVMEDVLIAAQFQTDVAAAMLSELVRETTTEGTTHEPHADLVVVDWATLQHESDSENDAEMWHDVAASRPEMQQWVLVQDEWEVVDSDVAISPSKQTRSFADVLRTSSAISAATALPSLAPMKTPPTTSLASLVRQKKPRAAAVQYDSDDVSVKSFGSRKRRFQRKFRR